MEENYSMKIVKPSFIFDEDTNNVQYRYLAEQILYCIVNKGDNLEIRIQSPEEGRAKGIPNMDVFDYHFNPLTNIYTGCGWTRMPDGDKRYYDNISNGTVSIEFPVTSGSSGMRIDFG